MTIQPDPAAVRCNDALALEYMKRDDADPASVITRACALPEGRALAEAVLSVPRLKALGRLARAYLKALDGSQDASRRVGDSPSSDAKP